jgi:hypothetical protein
MVKHNVHAACQVLGFGNAGSVLRQGAQFANGLIRFAGLERGIDALQLFSLAGRLRGKGQSLG